MHASRKFKLAVHLLSEDNPGAISVDNAGLSPFCAESPRPFHNHAVGDASGNQMRPSRQTKNCLLSKRHSDGPMGAGNETKVGKRFDNTFQNFILLSLELKLKAKKLHLMQGPTSAHLDAANFPVTNMQTGIYNIWKEAQNNFRITISSKDKQRHETVYGRISCILSCILEYHEVKPGLCEIQQIWEPRKRCAWWEPQHIKTAPGYLSDGQLGFSEKALARCTFGYIANAYKVQTESAPFMRTFCSPSTPDVLNVI